MASEQQLALDRQLATAEMEEEVAARVRAETTVTLQGQQLHVDAQNLGAVEFAAKTKQNPVTTIEIWKAKLSRTSGVLSAKHTEVANIHSRLGQLYLEVYDFDEALKQHEAALQIKMATFGVTDVRVAKELGLMGNVHNARREYDDAVKIGELGLEEWDRRAAACQHYFAVRSPMSCAWCGLHRAQLEDVPEPTPPASGLAIDPREYALRRDHECAAAVHQRALRLQNKAAHKLSSDESAPASSIARAREINEREKRNVRTHARVARLANRIEKFVPRLYDLDPADLTLCTGIVLHDTPLHARPLSAKQLLDSALAQSDSRPSSRPTSAAMAPANKMDPMDPKRTERLPALHAYEYKRNAEREARMADPERFGRSLFAKAATMK